MVKNIYSLVRDAQYKSQHPHSSSQTPVTAVHNTNIHIIQYSYSEKQKFIILKMIGNPGTVSVKEAVLEISSFPLYLEEQMSLS